MGSFREQLAFGKTAESKIASWFRHRGHFILPVYDTLDNEKQGPRLWGPTRDFIAPDILVWNHKGTYWIEAKHKTVFTWHRISKNWQTGIDRRHYHSYVGLAKEWRPWKIWLVFLHECSIPDEMDMPFCPPECPTGLYGGELLKLTGKVHHEHENHGTSGMVYWNESDLNQLATLDEVDSVSVQIQRRARR